MKTTKKIYYRVETPLGFSNEGAKTLIEAYVKLDSFGTPKGGRESEHFDYWQEQKRQCKIVRVTEIIEEEMTNLDFLALAEKGVRSDATLADCFGLPVPKLSEFEERVYEDLGGAPPSVGKYAKEVKKLRELLTVSVYVILTGRLMICHNGAVLHYPEDMNEVVEILLHEDSIFELDVDRCDLDLIDDLKKRLG